MPALSRPIHARKVAASTAHHAPTEPGPRMTRPPSSQKPPRIRISRSCFRCGPDSVRATCSGCHGPRTTVRISAFANPSGVRVVVPVGAPLKSALDAAARTKMSPLVLVNLEGKPWTADGFRSSWRKASASAGVVGVTFHDLRGTAVTRLAKAGCTEAEIATLTAHTLRDVRSILDSNYLQRDPALAESAIRKLERRTKTPD
jgi:hypothetical protein